MAHLAGATRPVVMARPLSNPVIKQPTRHASAPRSHPTRTPLATRPAAAANLLPPATPVAAACKAAFAGTIAAAKESPPGLASPSRLTYTRSERVVYETSSPGGGARADEPSMARGVVAADEKTSKLTTTCSYWASVMHPTQSATSAS